MQFQQQHWTQLMNLPRKDQSREKVLWKSLWYFEDIHPRKSRFGPHILPNVWIQNRGMKYLNVYKRHKLKSLFSRNDVLQNKTRRENDIPYMIQEINGQGYLSFSSFWEMIDSNVILLSSQTFLTTVDVTAKCILTENVLLYITGRNE